MKYVATIIIAVVVLLVAGVASADNYGNVSRQEYQRNANAVYTAFASRWGSSVGHTMVRCMNRESNGNRLAANYRDSNGGSYGLLQLNGVHRWRTESLSAFRQRMWTVRTHIQAAVRLYAASVKEYGYGLKPWGGGC